MSWDPPFRFLLAFILFASFVSVATAQSLNEKFFLSAKNGSFQAMNLKEIEQLEKMFISTLSKAQPQTQVIPESIILKKSAEGLVTIQDKPNRGRGFFIFRSNNYRPIFLQSPHRFSDKYTGRITLALFKQGKFGGGAWNSVHRHNGSRNQGMSSDFAHIENSPFSAHGRAIAKVKPSAVIIQIHGFSRKKRRSQAGATADLIISSGSHWPSHIASRMANCLAGKQLGQVRLYPREVRELGGVTNVTGKTLRAMGFPGFIHLEMSLELRKKLIKNKEALNMLARCLEG